jgi:very-short-patch-repair endonuclease
MIKKYCLTCNKEFQVNLKRKNSAKFCSVLCKALHGRVTKKCLFCQKVFTTTNHLKRKYCSRECSNNSKKKRLERYCQICGKSFEIQKYQEKTAKYCSIKCRSQGISISLKGKYKGKLNPNYKSKVIITCKYCGKKFKVHEYRKYTAKHCSISCSKLDTSKETRQKIANSIKKLQKENPKIHPNYILSQKGHITKIEKMIRDELLKRNIKFKMQYKILSYWVDFAFPGFKLAVECDGKRWHSTKKQKLNDKKRDSKITRLGWTIKRFKGKEINKNPKKVVDKIEIYLRNTGQK